MQKNLDAFSTAESGGTLWCCWGAGVCNQTAESAISSRLNAFLPNNAATGDHSWNVIQSKASSLVSLNSSSSSVYIFNEDLSRVHVYKPRSKVSFGRIEIIRGKLYAFVGEENGSIYVFQIDSQSSVSLFSKCESKFSSSIQFIVPHPDADNRSAFHIWVLSDFHISLLGCPISASIPVSNDLEKLLTYKLEQTQGSTLLRVQLLNTMSNGPSSMLSVQLRVSSGAVQVYLLDAAAALSFTAQFFNGRVKAVTQDIPLGPVAVVPFESSVVAGGTPSNSTSGISTLFSFNRNTSSQQQQHEDEIAVACVIEQSSVRTVGRASSATSPSLFSHAPVASFILRIAGSEGTEIAATYRSAQQQVLDALMELGSAVFSRAHSELATTSAAATAGKPLLAAQLQHTVFKTDGSILSSKEIEVGPIEAANSSGAGPELLWRACVRLQLLPYWRLPAVTAAIAALDSSAESSSNSNKYFAVSRAVLMETALVGGLGHLVAQYVLVRSEGGESGDFLLSDVKRVYEWAVGRPSSFAMASLQSSLEAFVRNTCKSDLVLPLLSSAATSSINQSVVSELQAALDVASGLRQVVEALLERKQNALEGEEADNHVVVRVIEEGQLALRVQIHELLCLQQIILVLLEVAQTPSLSFRALLPSEVHNLQRGQLHSSAASSSGAAASMLSEYHFAVSHRLQVLPQMRFLPEYLRAGDTRLFDELCAILDESSAKIAGFLRIDGDSALGVNLDHLAASITDLLLLPLAALKTETTRFLSALPPHAHRADSHMQDAEHAISGKAQVGHSVVLYFLLEMAQLSASSSQSAADLMRANVFHAVQSLTRRFGAAAGLSHTVRCGVQALWQIDAGVAVAEAVRLIGSRDTSITQDQTILATVLRRLLSADHLAACKALLTHLGSARHPIVQTKFFIMATATAVPRPDMWQFSWHAAKTLSAAQYGENSAEHVLMKRELVHMLLQWALLHDEVGRLLDSVLDAEEQDEVELALRHLATEELEQHALPAPALDLCVAFLVRRARFTDAMEMHERQAALVSAGLFQHQKGSEEFDVLLQSIEVRKTLIEAHASIPTISVSNFHL